MHAVRKLAYLTFVHMHELSLRFHLERKTGGLTRVLERGRLGIEVIVRMVILQLVPTIVEVSLLMAVLLWQFDWRYVLVDHDHGRGLHVLHLHRDRMADRDPPPDERFRHRGQHQGDQLAAQLRDGEVFRRRGARGAALRPFDGALRARQRQDLYVACGAQRRAGGDLHLRPDRDHADVRGRRAQRHQHGRRFRHGQRHDDPAVPAAEFHGHGVSRDQAGDHRHREDVRGAVAQSRGQGRARRQAAAGHLRHCAVRRRALRLRSRAPDPQGSELRGAGRQDGRDRRSVRRRQVDDLAAAVPALRRLRRQDPDRRPGHPRRHADVAARLDRHGAAGHRAVQRHHPLQHPLRPLGRHRRRGGGGGAGPRRSTPSSGCRRRATRPRSASAA